MAEYIEREKVIEILNDNIGNSAIRSAVNSYPEEYFDGWTDAVSEAITEVEGIPAADVRPERHGEWLLDDSDEYANHYHCSVCGAEKDTCNEIYDEPPPNYCENCGAKMDGKDGNKND